MRGGHGTCPRPPAAGVRWAAGAGALCATLVLLVAACATNPVTGKQDLVLVSEAQELSLGQQAHQQILREYQPYAEPALQSYVESIGQRLAKISHRTDISYRFTLLDSTEINAFALPGGYIYITRGLLAYMNSEAELAAVLGHELGHVTARHGVRQASSAQAASIGTSLLSIFLPQLAQPGISQGVGLLSTALLRGYGREHELEADRLGAEYLARAGYDPMAMLDVIRTLKSHELLDQKLAKLEGRSARAYHGLFSTHPDNDTRLKETIQHATTLAQDGERARDRFLERITGLVFGDNPAEGVVTNGVFMHPGPDVRFDLPPGWLSRNEPAQLLLADPDQNAFLVVQSGRAGTGMTPAALLEKAGIANLTRAEAISPAGLPGVTGLAQVAVGDNRRPARVSAVIKGQHGYIFIGITRDPGRLGQFDNAFRSVPASMRPLSATETAGLRPHRIAVRTLEAATSWQALAKTSPIASLPEEQLRVLNAATSAAVPAGSTIKLVE